MDGSTVEHSDSDSGESWTLLENCSTYVVDKADFAHNLDNSGNIEYNHERNLEMEKDEDTDGISIISDSDPESTPPCELIYDTHLLDQNHPTETQDKVPELANSIPPNNTLNESMRGEDELLGDNTGKLKTYVHRRNKRLSTVLNIIMLGSVITAAGVAIGHMWGAKNDCSMHTTPSVNKILSNLYKLQEENAFLRNKLKELTLANNIQMQQRKPDGGKVLQNQQRCKKVFEEPLNNKNAEKLTKCVDEDLHPANVLDSHVKDYEKEFLEDVNRLKNVYEQNKSWLDEEIIRRMKHENKTVKKTKSNFKREQKLYRDRKFDQSIKTQVNTDTLESNSFPAELNIIDDIKNESAPDKIITYAESLKTKRETKKENQLNSDVSKKEIKIKKRTAKRDFDTISEVSEEESKKDNRYVLPKHKVERKKNDRQKIHKKQKRRNKYEQWEMKGGYMKDYDDLSISSVQDNDLKNINKNLGHVNGQKNYINKYVETDSKVNSKSETSSSKTDYSGKTKEAWYDHRAAMRSEARRKLDQELFGGKTPNNAGWYFRRMQKREQCRTKADNSTNRKFSKRNMNFKMKY